MESNPDYWKDYRSRHPAYVKRNREQQRQRNARLRDRSHVIAKKDEIDPALGAISMPCELVISRRDLIAKKDEIRAAVRLVSRPLRDVGG